MSVESFGGREPRALSLSPRSGERVLPRPASRVLLRTIVIGLTAFLTVVDLFATQAILPTLTRAYGVTPAAMGFAVNASTIGMAVAGLIVSVFSRHIDRRSGILLSLAALSVPTALLALAPDLTTFTLLRVAQGLCMASAFTLTLAYLGDQCSAADAGGAFAAYITGNVAGNLVGRLTSAAVADHLGLASNFYFFAALNLAGAGLVYFTVQRAAPMEQNGIATPSPYAAWLEHLRNPQLRAAFGIGFCILFAFIGTFTYVNFVLVRAPLSLGPMQLGFVYFVFLPSLATTLLAGWSVHCFGTRPTLWCGLAVAGFGLPLLLLRNLAAALSGMVLIRRWDLFRSGDGNRIREPSRHRGPRLGQRHLSRLLLCRRSRRHRDPRPNLRSARLAGLRGGHWAIARRRRASRRALEDARWNQTTIVAFTCP